MSDMAPSSATPSKPSRDASPGSSPIAATPGAALVTGAGRRIGAAIARDLAAHGWAVAVHYRASRDEAEKVVDDITDKGGRAVAVAADLSRRRETASLVAAAADRLGQPLACLVNNASVFQWDTPSSVTDESWDLHLETNLTAPFFLSQAFAAQCPKDRPGGGNIINIIDQRVWKLTAGFTSYSVAKAGLWALTRICALAFAPAIRVNGIGPGPTLPAAHHDEADFARQWQGVPLKRPTDPEDIAAAIRFCLTTPSLTGQMLALDGGEHLGRRVPEAEQPGSSG